jgi:DNA-binding winged helix-turn-helix (wHTH) protein/tetratricopeptide (TPR) repeat protein
LEVGNVLSRAGRTVHLAPKEMATLQTLVENSGRVISKDDLMSEVWPAGAVADSSLSRCIYILRKILGGRREHFIETVARRGFRFAAPVRRHRVAKTPEAGRPPRLAVVPFDVAGENDDDVHLREGLAEELTARLTRLYLYGLVVVAYRTARRFRGPDLALETVARELDLDYVLAGNLHLSGKVVHLRARLVRVRDQAQVWAESFERAREDLAIMEAEIASAIAARLPLTLPGLERLRLARALHTNPLAYEAYLQGRYYWSRRGQTLGKALESYQRAIELDPGYAPAHVGITEVLGHMALWGQLKSGEAAARARRSLGRALALDPNLASAHAALGWLTSMFDGDMAAAEASFARALSLDPGAADAHGSYSIHLLASGHLEESLQEIQAELELDPRSQVTYASRAWVLFCSRRFDEALAEARRAIEIDPGYAASHSFLGAIAGHVGAFDEALIAGGKAAVLAGDFSTWGYVCARAGRRDEAKLVLERAAREGDNHATPSRLAAIALALEERDSALGWLERALERRCIWLRLSLADPRLDPLRDEPRFRAIVGRVSKARIATPPALGRRGGRSL